MPRKPMPVHALTTVATRGKQNTDQVSGGLLILLRYKHTRQAMHSKGSIIHAPAVSSVVLSRVYIHLLGRREKCQEAPQSVTFKHFS